MLSAHVRASGRDASHHKGMPDEPTMTATNPFDFDDEYSDSKLPPGDDGRFDDAEEEDERVHAWAPKQIAQVLARSRQPAAAAEHELPSSASHPWISGYSAEGHFYYYNTATGESQWEAPEGVAAAPAAPAAFSLAL